MTDVAATTLASIKTVQLALKVIYGLSLTAWRFPPPCSIINGSCYDFIIVGGGTAGCVLANRLSANSSYAVLLIEAGGHTPLESNIPGLVPYLHRSQHDYQMTSVNDNRTTQSVDGQVDQLTAGKMLGGGSAINLMVHVHGDPYDFNNWANILRDDSWNYTNIQKYMKRQETLTDVELLASRYASLHGHDGPVHVRRYTNPANTGILAAAQELGIKYVEDSTSTTSTLGITEPLINVDNGLRQSSSVTYLSKAKCRKSFCVLLHTTATKILIKNKVAIGVHVVDAIGKVYKLYSRKEVIVSAGALRSPQLLMLSGIGPKSHLDSLGINVVADLPVGKNFQNHPPAFFAYQMERDDSPAPAPNLYEYPVPITCLYAALNSSQTYPDYQAITLMFPHDSIGFVQVCKNVFKYNNNVCNKWYAASASRTLLLVVLNLLHPKSRGKLLLASADYRDNPLVYTGTYTDSGGQDLAILIKSLLHYNRLKTTSYFKRINAKLVYLGMCSNTTSESEFWSCYALQMSSNMWHYLGTCSMGRRASVLDSSLRVRGVAPSRGGRERDALADQRQHQSRRQHGGRTRGQSHTVSLEDFYKKHAVILQPRSTTVEQMTASVLQWEYIRLLRMNDLMRSSRMYSHLWFRSPPRIRLCESSTMVYSVTGCYLSRMYEFKKNV